MKTLVLMMLLPCAALAGSSDTNAFASLAPGSTVTKTVYGYTLQAKDGSKAEAYRTTTGYTVKKPDGTSVTLIRTLNGWTVK